MNDITTGVSASRTRGDAGGFQPISDFAGVRRFGREPIPDFGTIHWTGVKINGSPIGSAAALFGFSLVSNVNHPRLLIRTSHLSPSGDSFTNTWVAGR